VREGLREIRKTPRPGIEALFAAAGVPHAAATETDLGFRVGPRLNAAGRVGDATRSSRILVSESREDAARLARELSEDNALRQREEERIAAAVEAALAAAGEIPPAIVLSDPTPAVADFAWQADLEEFRWAFTSPDASRSYAAVRNGTRVLTGDANGLSLTNDVTVVRTYPQRAAGAVEHDLVLEFTPADGVTLAVGEPLPDGTITKTGSFTWTRNGRSRHFVVTTIAPLVWEASCTTALKIVSGEIRATLADGGYVRTVWTGCGEAPERSWVPGT